MHVEIEAELMIIAAVIAKAIADTEHPNAALRKEAYEWLWDFCPTIAAKANLTHYAAKQPTQRRKKVATHYVADNLKYRPQNGYQ